MEKKLTAHEEKLNETKRKISANSASVLLIGNTNDTIMARDENFFTSRLLTQVGYQYAISTSDNSESGNGGDSVNMKMTLERLLKTDPDVIILMTGKTDDIDADGKRPIEKNVLWKKLKAVKTDMCTTWTAQYGLCDAVWTGRMLFWMSFSKRCQLRRNKEKTGERLSFLI